ncbi:MAG: TolC family protein, partial [Longimicrobiales bacterium]
MNARIGRAGASGVVAVVVCVLAWVPVVAQEPPGRVRNLSLEEALRLAEESSEQVAITRAGVTRSRGEQKRAKSEYFPQVFGSASYTRTLRSEFQDIDFGGVVVDTAQARRCDTFTANPSLPLAQRVDSLEAMVGCSSGADPFAGIGDLPFGREHQYNVGVSVSQTVFSGGRVQSQNRIARVGRETAETELQSSRAQLALDVTQAYYDAVLSDRLLAIAEQTLAQADTTLAQVRLAFNVGNQAEFEVLRAKVTFDNQRPVVIQRESDRTLAYIRLEQLLDLPLDAPLALTSELEGDGFVPVSNVAAALDLPLDTTTMRRAPVRQAADAVRIQEQSLKIAKSQRLPNISLNTTYGRVAYPVDVISDFGTLRSNWTVAASLQVPIFTGGRISGDEMVARANLDEARARLELTEELAALDTRTALEQLEAAEATWQASQGTIEQAAKAYSIA